MKNCDRSWMLLFLMSVMAFLQACSPARPLPATLQSAASMAKPISGGSLLPNGIFNSPNKSTLLEPLEKKVAGYSSPFSFQGRPASLTPSVILYISQASKTYLETIGIDAKINARTWELFFRKYKIPFQTISTVERLESSVPGVLVLPSSVALSQREKQAIAKFRALGGSVLATWLTGVRDESGAWQGFQFMENTLDVKVAGDTEKEEEVNFMMPYGNTPVTHSLPAGQRIWLERVKGVYPLRLVGQHVSAQIMDWSRTAVREKSGGTVVFDERAQSSGVSSRSVVLGFPERLWLSADPKSVEAIAHNALMWLLRQPDVYLSPWPYMNSSALSVVVDALDVVDDLDIKFADGVEKAGGRASYYVLTMNAAKSLDALKKLQSKGHEVAYMGDLFEGFQGQPQATQSKRLNTMLQEMKNTGPTLVTEGGFHAPMESQDKTTEALLNQLGFPHFIAFMDASDGRVPVLVNRTAGAVNPSQPLVILPRTMSGPEDLMAEGEPQEGLNQFVAEFDLSRAMGSLSVVRFPNQSLLTDDQLKAIFDRFKSSSDDQWFATSRQVAQWWVERQRINVDLDSKAGAPRMTVTITGDTPLKNSASILINLPYAKDSLRMVADGHDQNSIKIKPFDQWRSAVSLEKLMPGKYSWWLYFDRSTLAVAK